MRSETMAALVSVMALSSLCVRSMASSMSMDRNVRNLSLTIDRCHLDLGYHSTDGHLGLGWPWLCLRDLWSLNGGHKLYLGKSSERTIAARSGRKTHIFRRQSQTAFATTIGTVMITVDAATNQTATTTMYHSVS